MQNGATKAQPLTGDEDGATKDMRNIITKARVSWLRNTEVFTILQSVGKEVQLRVSTEPASKPNSGSLYLFNRKQTRFFRRDGWNWKKKSDGKTVKEVHEKLKIGSKEALNCYYAHAEDGIQRRCYWILEGNDQIVLVHYLDNSGAKAAQRSSYLQPRTRNLDGHVGTSNPNPAMPRVTVSFSNASVNELSKRALASAASAPGPPVGTGAFVITTGTEKGPSASFRISGRASEPVLAAAQALGQQAVHPPQAPSATQSNVTAIQAKLAAAQMQMRMQFGLSLKAGSSAGSAGLGGRQVSDAAGLGPGPPSGPLPGPVLAPSTGSGTLPRPVFTVTTSVDNSGQVKAEALPSMQSTAVAAPQGPPPGPSGTPGAPSANAALPNGRVMSQPALQDALLRQALRHGLAASSVLNGSSRLSLGALWNGMPGGLQPAKPGSQELGTLLPHLNGFGAAIELSALATAGLQNGRVLNGLSGNLSGRLSGSLEAHVKRSGSNSTLHSNSNMNFTMEGIRPSAPLPRPPAETQPTQPKTHPKTQQRPPAYPPFGGRLSTAQSTPFAPPGPPQGGPAGAPADDPMDMGRESPSELAILEAARDLQSLGGRRAGALPGDSSFFADVPAKHTPGITKALLAVAAVASMEDSGPMPDPECPGRLLSVFSAPIRNGSSAATKIGSNGKVGSLGSVFQGVNGKASGNHGNGTARGSVNYASGNFSNGNGNFANGNGNFASGNFANGNGNFTGNVNARGLAPFAFPQKLSGAPAADERKYTVVSAFEGGPGGLQGPPQGPRHGAFMAAN